MRWSPGRSSTTTSRPTTCSPASVRSIDKTEYKEQAGFQVNGADKACAASSSAQGSDAATMAAVNEREVVTVRLTAVPPGKTPALQRSLQMLEGVLSSVAG